MKVLSLLLVLVLCLDAFSAEPPDFKALKWPQVKLRDGRVMKDAKVERVDSRGAWMRWGGQLDLIDFNLFQEPQKSLIVKAHLADEEWKRLRLPKEYVATADDPMVKQLNSEAGGVARIAGVLYKVEHLRISPVSVRIGHPGGVSTVQISKMSAQQQELFFYEPMLNARWPYLNEREREIETVEWRKRVDAKMKQRQAKGL
jgi:hypothetical protein